MKVVEFFGMPRAGKTTQTRMLVEKFKQQAISFNTFQKSKEIISKANILEELNISLYEELLKYYENQTEVDYLIYDRGFYDRLALSTADYERGSLEEPFKNEFVGNLEGKLATVDVPLLLLVDPETSLARKEIQIREGLHEYFTTNIPLPKDIGWLQHLYDVYSSLKEKYHGIHIIDSKKTKEEVHQEVVNILNL